MRKSPFKSNDNLSNMANPGGSKGQISSSKLESLKSSENNGYTPQLKRVQNMNQNRSNSSSQAHASRPGQQVFSNQNSVHNQSVASSQSQNHMHSISNHNAGVNMHRNENILCAVLALIKELNESELELIKRDIDKKLQVSKKQH